MRLTIAALALAAALAAFADARALAAGPPQASVRVAVPVPAAGRITGALFEIELRLAPGAVARPAPQVLPVRRSALPHGVAVVGTIRLLRHSAPGTAAYVGLLAAFRSKTALRSTAASRGGAPTEEKPEVISALVHWGAGIPLVEKGKLAEIVFGDSQASYAERMQLESGSPPLAKPVVLDGLDVTNDLGYDAGHDFSWSLDRPPSADVLGAVTKDLEAGLSSGVLTPGLLSDIELGLEARFEGFGSGSLEGDGHTDVGNPSCSFFLDDGANVADSQFQVRCAHTAFDTLRLDVAGHSVLPYSAHTQSDAYGIDCTAGGSTLTCTISPAFPATLPSELAFVELGFARGDPAAARGSSCGVRVNATLLDRGRVVASKSGVDASVAGGTTC